MIGAIVGDIVGSVYEFDNLKSKDFPLFQDKCFFTDDTVMTIAVAEALKSCEGDWSHLADNTVKWMRRIGQHYPSCGYGGRFAYWMFTDDPKPYNSYGNGAAMRVSPVAYFAKSLEECERLAEIVAAVTHNNPEGIKGAKATAGAVWLALHWSPKTRIRKYLEKYYELDFSLDEIRPTYSFDETCQNTVPQAMVAFLESRDFEDAIRNAISVGGDSDTLAAITGSVAGAYYEVPQWIEDKALGFLDWLLEFVYHDAERAIEN